MRKTKGFSLIELLIVVAIILVIAAIAVPSFLQSRITAYQSAAVASLRTLNSAQITYNSTYPTVGFAASLANLAGTCTGSTIPTTSSACLIDSQLATGTKSGYVFTLTNVSGTPATTYSFIAAPVLLNYSGVHYYCSTADAVVRVSTTTIAACDGTISPQQ